MASDYDILSPNQDGNLPSFNQANVSQVEYIRALEMAVQMLQREVEHLRNQSKPTKIAIEDLPEARKYLQFQDGAQNFISCKTAKEVLFKLHELLARPYDIIESNIFFFTSDRKLLPVSDSETSLTLEGYINYFEEQGIIDWAVERKSASVIPNLSDSGEISAAFFILIPLFLRGSPIGVYIAKTSHELDSFDSNDLESLSRTAEYAAIALDNIRSSDEIGAMNRRLNNLGRQMMHSSKMASLGELAEALAKEINIPLKIINTNFQLIESGIGDTGRRLEIIKIQIGRIEEINRRLAEVAGTPTGEVAQDSYEIISLIEEALLFCDSQLQRDNIRVEKDFGAREIRVICMKSQLEQALLSLVLFARDSMPDGGIITVAVHTLGERKVVISISDTSAGLTGEDIISMFEPTDSEKKKQEISSIGLFIAKNIIEQHKGTISVFSEVGKGTTFKVILPVSAAKKQVGYGL